MQGCTKLLSSGHLGNLIWYGDVEYFQHSYLSFLPFIEDCVPVHMHKAPDDRDVCGSLVWEFICATHLV
jgi:hypothetical protein